MNMNYTITVEETISKTITVEATTAEEAMDKVQRMYTSGELVLDGDSHVTCRQMQISEPDDETTEWTEF